MTKCVPGTRREEINGGVRGYAMRWSRERASLEIGAARVWGAGNVEVELTIFKVRHPSGSLWINRTAEQKDAEDAM